MDAHAAISKILSEVEGAVDAVVFDENLADRIRDEEETVKSMAGPDVINKAYTETYNRSVKICVFCDRKISTHDGSSLTLEDPEGHIMGMTLTKSMIEEYKDRQDVLWISDDFIMFPEVPARGGERFILHPMKFPILDEKDGCYDVVVASPAPSSDIIIKRHYGVSLKEDLATMIVGFNITGTVRSRKE